MIIDPIGDMLTRIRNSISVHQETVDMPCSKIKEAILQILKQERYIADFKRTKNPDGREIIKVTLNYQDNKPSIRHLERVSKPGLRIYATSDHIPRVLSGIGTIIISTSQGLMSGKQARRKGVGGEIICRVW